MSSQTIRQRHGIEQYQAIERTRRSDFRDRANARGFKCAPVANDVPHAEDSSFGKLCLTILGIIGFAILATHIVKLSDIQQRVRDAQHACEAQGLRAVVVDREGRDDVVCVGGAR
jgi:hypothetical protein